MPNRKSRRGAPTVNAGSMADIAFLLLIFFLVTTTILEEEGVLVRLPVWDSDPPPIILNQDKVLTVGINKANELLVEGELAKMRDIPQLVEAHLNRPDFPPTEAIVSLTHDRSSSYEIYLRVYDALLSGYRQVRDQKSTAEYGKRYAELSDANKKKIRKAVPLVLSEAEPTDFEQ